jgi:hypothetical protein
MSTEAHSFITIPLETFHEPQASILQCLKEPSYAKTVKDLCTQPRKSRNHRPKKILRSKQVGYIRWRNIPLEGYQILKNKGWKGLVGHPRDWGRHCKFSFTFLYSWFLSFYFYFFSFLHLFLTTINLSMFVSMRNIVVSFCWQVFWCLSLGDALTFHTSMFPYFW